MKGLHLRQSIVLSERVLKSIVENNEKFKRTHVSLIPGLLSSWGGLEVDYKWIIIGLQVDYKWIISENAWTNGCILSKVDHIVSKSQQFWNFQKID